MGEGAVGIDKNFGDPGLAQVAPGRGFQNLMLEKIADNNTFHHKDPQDMSQKGSVFWLGEQCSAGKDKDLGGPQREWRWAGPPKSLLEKIPDKNIFHTTVITRILRKY